jgi:hypothetical protein
MLVFGEPSGAIYATDHSAHGTADHRFNAVTARQQLFDDPDMRDAAGAAGAQDQGNAFIAFISHRPH